MTLNKKIVFPLIVFAWLFGLQAIALNATPAETLSLQEASHQQQFPSSNDSSHLFQASPFLPGLFVESEWHAGTEIEPDSHHRFKNSSNSDPLVTGSHYLRISKRATSYHPALKLIFPFHTYL
jgi:hypothetical protein